MGDVLCYDAAWSPDGKEIAYTVDGGVYAAKPDGSGIRLLAKAPGSPWWPRWSPDGRRIRFTVYQPMAETHSLWEAPADGSHARPLFPKWSSPPAECCGDWTPDGNYFIFQSSREGTDDLWVVREKDTLLPGSESPVRLTRGEINFRGPVLSRDGRIIFVRGTIWRAEVLRFQTAGQPVPFLPGLSIETLAFSGDGQWIAYTTLPEKTLWRSRADGSNRLQLSKMPLRAGMPQWSPDGRQIVFVAREPGGPWRIALSARDRASLQWLTPGDRNCTDPTWSPDRKNLAFGGAPWLETSPSHAAIYLLDLASRQVSTVPGSEGLFSPRWSPSGRYLAALTADASRMLIFDFSNRQWREVLRAEAGFPLWSADGRYIYYLSRGRTGHAIARLRLADANVEELVSLKEFPRPSTAYGWWIGLHPDGSPLALRDLSTDEVYALEWTTK